MTFSFFFVLSKVISCNSLVSACEKSEQWQLALCHPLSLSFLDRLCVVTRKGTYWLLTTGLQMLQLDFEMFIVLFVYAY